MRDSTIDAAVAVDPREDKLPAWARDKFNTMRRATMEAVDALATFKSGTKPSWFWLEHHDDGRRYYLPKVGGRLMFGDPSQSDYRLELRQDNDRPEWLNINSHAAPLAARPQAANVLLIRSDRDRHTP